MFAKGTRMMEERKNAIEREKDDEARALWQIYIERPAESQFSLGPWQEKANEYGLRKAVSGGGQHKTCFEVRDAEWKSFVLLEIACRRGPWPFDAFMAMCSKGWVHLAFVFRDNDLASRMRKLERAYRSPYERYSDFLKDMTKAGLLRQAGSEYVGRCSYGELSTKRSAKRTCLTWGGQLWNSASPMTARIRFSGVHRSPPSATTEHLG